MALRDKAEALEVIASFDNPQVYWIVEHLARAIEKAQDGKPIHWDVSCIVNHAHGWKEQVKEQLAEQAQPTG